MLDVARKHSRYVHRHGVSLALVSASALSRVVALPSFDSKYRDDGRTGVIAAQKAARLFIAERKGQRHTRIGSNRIGILNENPLSSLGRAPRNEPPLARVPQLRRFLCRTWRTSRDISEGRAIFAWYRNLCAQRNYAGLACGLVDSRTHTCVASEIAK